MNLLNIELVRYLTYWILNSLLEDTDLPRQNSPQSVLGEVDGPLRMEGGEVTEVDLFCHLFCHRVRKEGLATFVIWEKKRGPGFVYFDTNFATGETRRYQRSW
jgi:hypothetical protein